MYHAVWKLSALAVVVAVGVVVVVQAQRGMPESGADDDQEMASGLENDGDTLGATDASQAGDPPMQGEPDVAADDEVIVSPRKSRVGNRKKAVLDELTMDDEIGTHIQTTAASARNRSAIDIINVEEDDVEDLGPPAGSEKKPAATALKETAEARSRGPVLTLDELDRDNSDTIAGDADAGTTDDAGPRLLGGGDEDEGESTGRVGVARNAHSDPFDEGAEAAENDDSLPAALPESPVDSGPRPLARDPFRHDADDADSRGPNEAKGKPPAALGSTIEPDDSEEMRPELYQSRRVRTRADDIEPAPRELQLSPEVPTGEPELPQNEDALPEERPAPPKPPLPQLTIEKLAPSTAVLGQPMIYHIRVRNTGTLVAQNVTVEDIVARDVQLDGSIPQAQLKENRLIWKLGTLAAGHEKKISVRVIPQAEGTIGTVATVNFSPASQPPSNAAAAQLEFDVDAPRQAAVGTPIDFRFRVKNVGPGMATGVTIRDVLPAGLRHTDGDDIEYVIGQLPAGKSREVKLTLTAAQAGPTVNRVVVIADGNVSEEAEVAVDVVGPALTVSRQGPRRLFPEKTGRYANTVTNPGASPAAAVRIVEMVPAGLEFIEAADGGAYNAAKRTVTWSINQLGPGQSKTVALTLRAKARDSQISVVRAYDNAGASGETVGTTHVAGVPALSIAIGGLAPLVEVGETITVSVRVLNRGSDSAANVRATVTVTEAMQLVAAKGPVERSKAAGRTPGDNAEARFAPIGKIEAQTEAVFELTFKARHAGPARIEAQVQCDQLTEPIRHEEVTTVVAPE